MFELIVLLLTLAGVQFQSYEDCTVGFSEPTKNTPIVRLAESFNDLPDDVRFTLC